MRIYQIVTSLSFGDAVGNDLMALQKVIEEIADESGIFADHIDPRLPEGIAQTTDCMPQLREDDVVIYHMACGTPMSEMFGNLPCKRVMRYHNITPPEFFHGYDAGSEETCQKGYEQLEWLKDKVDYCLAVSEYNKSDLRRIGFTCKIDILPILVPFSDYDKTPAANIIEQYTGDGWLNILFVGRIVPNKKHEDLVRVLKAYQDNYQKKARLILVGSSKETDLYLARLKRYIKELGLTKEDVVFPGHIKFDEILAFYKAADVFLCQSEHEGFCVPLVEAMYLGTPIIAYDASAIKDTLGGAGILMDTKDYLVTAGMIDRLVHDTELRKDVLDNQKERLKDFSFDVIAEQFRTLLKENVL